MQCAAAAAVVNTPRATALRSGFFMGALLVIAGYRQQGHATQPRHRAPKQKARAKHGLVQASLQQQARHAPSQPFSAYLLIDSLVAVAALAAASAADLAASAAAAPASLAASAALWAASLVASAALPAASLVAAAAFEAAALASAAASLAASAAALAASLAASTAGAGAGAGASTGAGAGAGTTASSFLPQAASATAAIIDARTRDFFIWIFLRTVNSCGKVQGHVTRPWPRVRSTK